jgi:ArsR family transcriptional regulator, arsenate/arsenite/antimonite-responsive transcriptional repressor
MPHVTPDAGAADADVIGVDVPVAGSKTAARRARWIACDPLDLDCCRALAEEPLSAERAIEVAKLLKAVADPVRLRLLARALAHESGEACVCELADGLALSQPTVSHHLKVLHQAGLVDRRKRGVWVYYAARPAAMAALRRLFTPVNEIACVDPVDERSLGA